MMKFRFNILFISLLIFSLGSYAQQGRPSIFGPVVGFTTEEEAREVIDRIVDVVGLKPNFEIKPADVPNASAVVYNGKRYILYNSVFLKQVRAAVRTDWGGISIIAHEIGHHLNGHTLMGTGSKPAIELEADEFAGFVLRKMGATLSEAQAAMSIISDERGSHTHPGRSLRLASIQTGWTHADEQSKGIVKAPSKESLLSKAGSPAKQTQVARYSFPKEYIYKTIHLYQFPKEQLLITVRSNLIKLDQKGYTVLGKLVNHNGNLYLVFEQGQYFRITDRGELLNNKNEMIGYLG